MTDYITLRTHPKKLEVVEAPERASISLAALANMDYGIASVGSDYITFGTPGVGLGVVTYHVTGWNPVECTLLLRRTT